MVQEHWDDVLVNKGKLDILTKQLLGLEVTIALHNTLGYFYPLILYIVTKQKIMWYYFKICIKNPMYKLCNVKALSFCAKKTLLSHSFSSDTSFIDKSQKPAKWKRT